MRHVTAERWKRIEALLDEAFELSGADLEAFLAEACAGDPDLRRDLEKLLHAEARAPRFLDVPAVDQALPILPDLPEDLTALDDEPLIHRIGPYRVVRELGRGGMSLVFLAERDDGLFEQQVAIKVLRRDLVTDELVRRFDAERRILAGLNHPNVARVFDGGLTEEERPYFVMEYVEGEPIDVYCDRHQLSIEARLRLFIDAAEAVQQAHHHFVVHRDLKPSNILVAEHGDGTPNVKLLDFGIAKLLDAEHVHPHGPDTRTGQRWMTPEYAAPEQVRGEAVTTATDVYALGVVLYELLSGHRPYESKHGMPHEMARAILEHEPSRPSTAVTRPIERPTCVEGQRSPEAVSQNRGLTLPRLRKKLRGDLDTICLKALRKKPERRYASAEALIEDLRRYLSGHPVEARPDTFAYRSNKFVRRHRWGLAMAVLLAVIAGVAAMQMLHAHRQAQLEMVRSSQVAQFMSGLFQSFDPSAARGGIVQVEALLAQGVEQADRQLSDQLDVQARVLGEIGRLYYSYGLYDRAEALFERTLAQRQRLLGQTHPDVAESLHDLGRLFHVTARYEDAERALRRAYEQRLSFLGPRHLEVAASLNELGLTLQMRGRYDEAEALMREGLGLRRSLHGEDHADLVRSLGSLAFLMVERGRYDEAEALYREALEMAYRLYGDEHLDVADNLNSLASLLQRRDRLEEAEDLYRRALDLRRRIAGDDHPHVAQSMSHLGWLMRKMERYDEAERYLNEALAIRRAVHGDEHLAVANSLHQLGWLYYEQEAYAQSEPYYRQSLELYRKILGPDHQYVATALNALALLEESRGAYDAAEAHYREALALRHRLFGPDHDHALIVQSNLGLLLQDAGRLDEARSTLEDVLARRQRAFPGHWRVGHAMSALGGTLHRQGHHAEAEAMLTEAFAILREARGLDDLYTQGAVERLAALYEDLGQDADAARYRSLREDDPS